MPCTRLALPAGCGWKRMPVSPPPCLLLTHSRGLCDPVWGGGTCRSGPLLQQQPGKLVWEWRLGPGSGAAVSRGQGDLLVIPETTLGGCSRAPVCVGAGTPGRPRCAPGTVPPGHRVWPSVQGFCFPSPLGSGHGRTATACRPDMLSRGRRRLESVGLLLIPSPVCPPH